jgi:hypothetical protein
MVECLKRNRRVEVIYARTYGLFAADYRIGYCPTMYENDIGCGHSCISHLTFDPDLDPLH